MRIKDFGVVQVPAGVVPKQTLFRGCPIDNAKVRDALLLQTLPSYQSGAQGEDIIRRVWGSYTVASLLAAADPGVTGSSTVSEPLSNWLWECARRLLGIASNVPPTPIPSPGQEPNYSLWREINGQRRELINRYAPAMYQFFRDLVRQKALYESGNVASLVEIATYADARSEFEVGAAECDAALAAEAERVRKNHAQVVAEYATAWRRWRAARDGYAAELAAWQAAPEATPKSPLALAAALAAAGFAVAGPAGAVGGGVIGFVTGGGTAEKGPPPMDPGPEPLPPAEVTKAELATIRGGSVLIGAGR